MLQKKGKNDEMKYQIYLQKDVSEMINAIAQGLGMKPATFIKQQLESNYRKAYEDAVKLGMLNNGPKKQ